MSLPKDDIVIRDKATLDVTIAYIMAMTGKLTDGTELAIRIRDPVLVALIKLNTEIIEGLKVALKIESMSDLTDALGVGKSVLYGYLAGDSRISRKALDKMIAVLDPERDAELITSIRQY
ncbi:hypothetical protein CO057_01560 [Candidatus Uhrbacteria bacterium CG_4_9_14_0_2_um_filter_41_50]|uniref:Uncharacterized protein n=1 Tax=Candidatus Uhrbacteria bacterium CG_4_9_14_0_2_um_filter_41_50 TaxID=1975031 RepID=A0A2M8EPL5_9BACT|nr:MAG: hypothetical protein COY24_02400 [Candidatus Uhrbacteria bacterium CG_4_10_14_0_2_um_filter_41_21]PJB84330.1 MAG: hypothetical protein CO086_04150 [Candidatus Uhrbacteria bacterium CG_4_9_14_0_8_um_filter_41_16]PJC24676.1 MAG: hypothetical protein CO057_01560 [Candidatus Uhrbacteria bacterium CG_4_9_14_0_2_um_filter_41_50]PJE75065.1 MAG: hypothetical protein COV03_02085 [Candidatus Uhrbacteria bacterium CG10_big_fil_rev_8_21_14_0_10_41_26]